MLLHLESLLLQYRLTQVKIKVLIEALESGNYSSIKSDVYDGMLYDAPDHLKSLVNRFVELNNITEPLAVTIQTNYHHHVD
ncbi:mevalonate kinase [Staphylococcus aureus]|uniref:Mevalonate kinase n=1 Tax=Staphylococcus aureus TaxID=1280 RepID=A0A380EGK7_STAAU|nr:mevalonate kinase [Staphylococcus aureus]